MKKTPKVSVIIPVQKINDYLMESVSCLLSQKYPDFEIIILTDVKEKNPFGKKVRIISTGHIVPAEKRDIGAKKAEGEILAFIDDDAYPADELWLRKAVNNFISSDSLGALGGPSLTPASDRKFEKVCGEVLSSWLFSGPSNIRYRKAAKKEYNDLPSCNLFVSKKIFQDVKGFDCEFWPGEDTKLCADIIRFSKKVIYDPDVVVYHHRRKGIKNYIRQTLRFSVHRGYFMKVFPYTSLKIMFFIPSLFVLGLFFGYLLGLFHQIFFYIYISALLIYFILMLTESLKSEHISNIPLFLFLGFVTHLTYGIGVIIGLLIPNLNSRLKPKHET